METGLLRKRLPRFALLGLLGIVLIGCEHEQDIEFGREYEVPCGQPLTLKGPNTWGDGADNVLLIVNEVCGDGMTVSSLPAQGRMTRCGDREGQPLKFQANDKVLIEFKKRSGKITFNCGTGAQEGSCKFILHKMGASGTPVIQLLQDHNVGCATETTVQLFNYSRHPQRIKIRVRNTCKENLDTDSGLEHKDAEWEIDGLDQPQSGSIPVNRDSGDSGDVYTNFVGGADAPGSNPRRDPIRKSSILKLRCPSGDGGDCQFSVSVQ